MKPVGRRRARSIAVALLSTAAVLGALELGCRIFLSRQEALHAGSAEAKVRTADLVTNLLRGVDEMAAPLEADPDFVWRNPASLHKTQPVEPRRYGHDDSWTIDTNSRGYRGPEIAPRRRGVYRILCIGDSITFGLGVEFREAFPVVLESMLRERFPGREIEVIDAGVPGWSWLQGLRFLELEGLDLQPDLVIAAYGVNDRLWPVELTDRERLGPLPGAAVRELRRAGQVLMQTGMYRAVQLFVPPATAGNPSPGCLAQLSGRDAPAAHGYCRRVTFPEIEATVHEIDRLTTHAGIDLLVLNLDFLELGAVDASRRATRKDGVGFVDLVEAFDRARRAEEGARASPLGLAPAGPLAPALRAADAAVADTRGGRRVLLRVLAPGAPSVSVEGTLWGGGSRRFVTALYDDGSHGDERAHDQVFSTLLDVGPGTTSIEYRFVREGAAEFQSKKAIDLRLGSRVLIVEGDQAAPVAEFGDMYLMIERIHPDARGHRLIAELLLPEIEQLGSFRKVVEQETSEARAK